MDTRLRWKPAVGATLLGLVAITAGLWIAGFSKDAWSGALIGIGSALALLAVLAVLERRLVAEVNSSAERTARAVARQETGALEERIVRLEDLDDIQQSSREQRRRAASAAAEAVRSGGVDPRTIGTLLRDAAEDGLLAESIRVRTGPDPDCPILWVLVVVSPGQNMMYLDFQEIRVSGQRIDGVPVPDGSPTMVVWIESDAIADVVAELEKSLERSNQALDGFKMSYAVDRLTRSVEVMRAARAAPRGSPLRLEGRLRLLVNDDWVLTDWGLESVTTSDGYKAEYVTNISGSGSYNVFKTANRVLISDHERLQASPSLGEALRWLEEREGLAIGERPPKSPPPHIVGA